MRLDEIEDNDIEKLLIKYFEFSDYEILSDGRVNVNGPTSLRLAPPNGKLPVKFNKAKKDFAIGAGDLSTLEGCPRLVSGEFSCGYNQINSLIGGPIEIYGDYLCIGNNLKSLEGLPKILNGRIILHANHNLPLLKLLFVKDLQRIELLGYMASEKIIASILNKYIGTGQKGALQCAAELTKAGFKNNARM